MPIFESDTDVQKVVVVAVDFSDPSASALATARAVASSGNDTVRAVHVIDVLAGDTPFWEMFQKTERLKEELVERAETELASFLEERFGEEHGFELDVRFGKPADNIAAAASADDVELLVMGKTGFGRVESAVFGSTAERVVRMADSPVLMVTESGMENGPQRVLAPVDFSDCSGRGIRRAADLARRNGGEVLVFHALREDPLVSSPYYPSVPTFSASDIEAARSDRRERLDAFVKEEGVADVATILDVELTTSVTTAILEAAEEHDADLVCIGSHGRSGLERLMLGSNAAKLLRRAELPVLVVR